MEKLFEALNNLGNNMKSQLTRKKTNWISISIAASIAFLESVHRNSIEPTVWPYMKKLDFDASETEFGWIQGGQALTNALASGISGVIADKIYDTKPQLIIGNFITFVAVFAYFMVEFDFTSTIGLFITYNLLMGIGFGFQSVYRTYIAMETKEDERSKGFGTVLIAESIGLLLAPLIQLITSLIQYPGWKSPFGIHLNIYTAPVLLSLISCFFGYFCFHFKFNGRLNPMVDTESSTTTIAKSIESGLESKSSSESSKSYDKLAFIILTIIKVGTGLIMIIFSSITALYAMKVFAWTSRECIIFQSSLMIANGIVSLLIGIGYVFYKIDHRLYWKFGISERDSIIFSLSTFLIFFITTYPWWFINETIPYFHPEDSPPTFNRTVALKYVESSNSTDQFVGCNVDYEWCQYTPRINVYLYNVFLFLASGLALPIINLNLDILLSKVLGPINQGIQQAVFNIAGLIVNIFGPLAFTFIYEQTGPTILWKLEIITSSVCLLLMVLYYRRMVSYSLKE